MIPKAGFQELLIWVSENKTAFRLSEDRDGAEIVVIIQLTCRIADKPVIPVWIRDKGYLYLCDADWIGVWLSLGRIEKIVVHIHLGMMNKAL